MTLNPSNQSRGEVMSNAIPPEAPPADLPDLRQRLDEMTEGVVVDLGEILDEARTLEEAALRLVRSALEDEDAASRLEEHMAELEGEFNGFEDQAEAKRKLVLLIMNEAGLVHLEVPGLTIDVRQSLGSMVIVDEELIPDSFKVSQPGWVDYQKVHAALRQGTTVPGARLGDGEPSLVVRCG